MQPTRPTVYAIDFGTTNSLIAAANSSRVWEPLPVDPEAEDPSVLRSVLFFPDDAVGVSVGNRALRVAAETGLRGRLLRSFKRFLPMESFQATRIGSRRFALEELVAIVIRTLRERANRELDADVRALVLGCPARFSDDPRLDALARTRLRAAAELAGFERVELCEEPVAAALDCASLESTERLVTVVDLGGGTSDFTISRLSVARNHVLAVSGIALAGDALDGALMRERLAPEFGSKVNYRLPLSQNLLTFPRPLLERLCSPAELCLLDRREILSFIRDIQAAVLDSTDRDKIDRLLCLIEDRLGFQLFEAIDRVKRELSERDSALFCFDYPGIDVRQKLARSEFETSAMPVVDRILERLEQTLGQAAVEPTEIDFVYCTGGTARVPLILARLAERFGRDKLRQVRTFHAVIGGLAERARQFSQEIA